MSDDKKRLSTDALDRMTVEQVGALGRLRALFFPIGLAVEVARRENPDGEIRLAITNHQQDGGGRVIATWESEPFLRDLKALTEG